MRLIPCLLLLLAGCIDTVELGERPEPVRRPEATKREAPAPEPRRIETPAPKPEPAAKAEPERKETPAAKPRKCDCLGMHTFQAGVCVKCKGATPFLEHKYCDSCATYDH